MGSPTLRGPGAGSHQGPQGTSSDVIGYRQGCSEDTAMHTHTCAHSPGVSVGVPLSRPLLLRGALGLTRPSRSSPLDKAACWEGGSPSPKALPSPSHRVRCPPETRCLFTSIDCTPPGSALTVTGVNVARHQRWQRMWVSDGWTERWAAPGSSQVAVNVRLSHDLSVPKGERDAWSQTPPASLQATSPSGWPL